MNVPGPRRLLPTTEPGPGSCGLPEMLAMEDPPAGQALTWQEKEKLKEKLAFLKREYSKTFNRLQRAQRAERVKSYVKKTVAEQNRLLRQEETEKNTTELMDKQSPSGGNKPETCRLQTNTCSHSDAEKKMSVTFKLEPEFFNNEVNLQESSCAEGTNGGQENVLRGLVRSVIEENQNQLPRSRMTSVSEGRESACDVPPSSAGERLENQMASTEEPRSPIFKRRNNISDSKNSIQKAPRQVTVREEKCLTPQDPQLGDLQDAPKENVFLRVPRPLSDMLMGGSNVQQPVSPFAEDICDSCEPTPQCSVNNIHVSLENFEDMGKELACVENQMENECMSREELCGTSDLTSDNQASLAGRRNPSPNESRTHKERSHNETSHSCPLNSVSILDNTEEPLGNQETQIEARSPVLEKTPPAAESVLNTCTVVEGLLFPVEYYVRTTRRMSNCQRKVDLEAVILSQLGRSRKGLRNKCKQINSNPDQLSQETARSDVQLRGTPFPFLGAESDPVSSSSSSQKSLPSSDESSTSNGSLSQNSIISTKRAKGRSWRRGKGRQGFNCRPALNVSQAHPESSDLSMPKENSPHLSSEKENCEGDLEKSPIGKTKVLVTATDETIEAEMPDVIWPAEADLPDGSQTFGKWHQPSLEYITNPLQGNNFLNPSDEAFPSHAQGLEANVNVCQADKQPVEHLKNQYLQKACRAEQLPMVKESLPQRDPSISSVKRKARQGSKGKRGRSQQMDLDDPAPLGHLGLDSVSSDPPFHFQNEMLSLKWLPSKMDIREFHLPDEEFGLLKFEKLQSCTMKKLEPFVPSGSEHWLQSAGDSLALRDTRLKQMNTEGKSLEKSFISPSKTVSPKLSHLEGQLHKKGLSHRELLLTPASIVSAGATNQLESQIPTPAFPVLGTSPAILSRVHSDTLPVLPWQVETNFFREPASLVMEGKECYDSTGVLRSDSCRAGSDCRPDEAVTLKEYQPPGSGSKECCSAENTMTAEQLAVAPSDNLRDRSLHLASKLKNPSSSCAVDVSTVWWESAGCAELCIVTACETSISLWKPLASSQWRKMYTWHLTEIPVIQIVSLPDVHNLVCVALGDLEIGELRVLLCSSEDGSLKQSLVKTGSIKAVLGLTDRRLVSSSGTLQDQQIEVISVSTAGRSNERQTLMSPEDTILAFAEVEGIRDALVGTTAVNILVVWNLKTGQILKKMPVGYSYPASICHRAYSDSGLLFVVLSHPHAKEHESCGNPAFWMSVLNPKTARSTGVMFFSLPPGHSGRYLEGEVKGASAAAVLTSGTIAVWDLFLGQCTALLPPNTDGNWSLVRWSVTDSCLLAGQKDGSVYVYDYSQTKAIGK